MNIQCPNCLISNGMITVHASLSGIVHYNVGSGKVQFLDRSGIRVSVREDAAVVCNHCGYSAILKNFITQNTEGNHVPAN